MNAQFDNRLTSAMAVRKIGQKYNDVIVTIPALKKAFDDHNALILEIQGKRPESEKSTKGSTDAKDTTKQQLAQLDIEVTSALGALAVDTNNETLKAQCNYSASDFLHVRDGLLLDRSRLILKLAGENSALLATDYAVSEDDLEEMQGLINDFDDINTAPLDVINERKVTNAELKDLFKKLHSLYKKRLDKLMKGQETKQPVFFRAYNNARNIINLGVRHEKDEETVTTKVTEETAKG